MQVLPRPFYVSRGCRACPDHTHARPVRPAPARAGLGVVYAVPLVAIAFEKDVSEWRAHAR